MVARHRRPTCGREGRRVFLDAEHFFDGYRADPDYAARGASGPRPRPAPRSSPCATPTAACCRRRSPTSSTTSLRGAPAARLGIHCHNDTGCAVANTLAAVDAGATHVQGTVNGYGERTGNADLITVVANLELKHGRQLLARERLREATRIAHAISEITNVAAVRRQPYVGASAFAHKAGLHASAIKVDPDLYQHTDPRPSATTCACWCRTWPAGPRSSSRAASSATTSPAATTCWPGSPTGSRTLEAQGYTFDAADASFELLLREEVDGGRPALLRRRVLAGHHRRPRRRRRRRPRPPSRCVAAGAPRRRHRRGQRPGQRARPRAARGAVAGLPRARRLELIDFRVRILDAAHGTDAVTRVLIETMRRRDLLGDGRGGRQHRRGVLGGARRLRSPTA